MIMIPIRDVCLRCMVCLLGLSGAWLPETRLSREIDFGSQDGAIRPGLAW